MNVFGMVMLIVGSDNGSIGKRRNALFAYSQRRIFMEELGSAEFATGAQVPAKPHS